MFPQKRRNPWEKYTGLRLKKYLLHVWAWYYGRYFPSIARLRCFLEARSGGDTKVLEEVWQELLPLFVEKNILLSRIEYLQGKWKKKEYILLILKKQGFEEKDISEILAEKQEEFSDWNRYVSLVEKKILQLKNKNKTRKEIAIHLRALFPQFWDLISEHIEQFFQDEDEDILFQKLFLSLRQKYGTTPSAQKRITQNLLRRGFSWSKIKTLFSRQSESDFE